MFEIFDLVKKAYHRMSLEIHPDRVSENEKEKSTEKFKVLTKINSILINPNKRAIYDEHGVIEDDSATDCDWREIFNQVVVAENEDFQQSYIGIFDWF